MGGFASPCRATSWSRWCSTPCSASGSITSSPETTSPACWPCPLSASWQAASSRPSNDRPAARPRAGPPRRPLVGRPCGDVRVLPRRGRPLRPRGAAEARARRRPDRVRCAAPGPGRSSRATDHSFDRRPLPRPRLAAARRQCAFACAGRIRPGHRGGIVRGRGRTTRAGSPPAAASVTGHDALSHRLDFATTQATEFVDITDRIRDEVRRAGLRTGRVHLQSLHTTLGLAINENEPLLLKDFESLLDRLAPAGARYEHPRFTRRTDLPPPRTRYRPPSHSP